MSPLANHASSSKHTLTKGNHKHVAPNNNKQYIYRYETEKSAKNNKTNELELVLKTFKYCRYVDLNCLYTMFNQITQYNHQNIQ